MVRWRVLLCSVTPLHRLERAHTDEYRSHVSLSSHRAARRLHAPPAASTRAPYALP
eukprot:CAMPEP_0195577376 /NCGR_PEP_ID=MMETSP0814-20130614/10454_1 /TAXON_ID=97485 /ORGANISM="Prymnesium parvum, Strain Texoma1" /LENGTH=55 /DNA_ID=CAMNT_0040713763 /DNA_START=137 /DNA_END=300 /DNA_ORIENTATION=+